MDERLRIEATDVEPGLETMVTVKVAPEREVEFPTWKKGISVMVALNLILFLVAVDRTIIGTAIPKITDEFHSIKDVGWYGSAYLLTSCAFQLIYARIYTFYSPKWIILWALGIFEVGSAMSAAAPSSVVFILGRAVSGFGTAGLFSGSTRIMVVTVPLHKRHIHTLAQGIVMTLAAVFGPLLGGVFTDRLSWRWCYWINIPFGALVSLVLMLILHAPPSKNTDTIRQQILKLDPYGSTVFLPGVLCLLLAFQWGGTTYSWSNSSIIALFILAGILLGSFCYIQIRSADNATVPIRIIAQRSILSGVYYCIFLPGSMFIAVFYLPIWFQVIKGLSAFKSGVDLLPLVAAFVAGTITSGRLTSMTGYYVPQLLGCSVMLSIGAGLFTTFQVDTDKVHWALYQIIYGFGLGLGMAQVGTAAHASLDKKDITTGSALMTFFQSLGGAIWLTIAQTIFTSSLISRLSHITDLDPAMIINNGATDMKNLVSPKLLPAVLEAYNAALSDVFKLGAACAAATIIAGLTMEWRNVKKGGQVTKFKRIKREDVGIQLMEIVTAAKELSANDSRPSTTDERTLFMGGRVV